jgi:hypothetical protein
MKLRLLLTCLLSPLFADELPILASPDFRSPLDASWKIAHGIYAPNDGVLVCAEKAENKHVAVLWHQVGWNTGVIECEFRLDGSKVFILGCDGTTAAGLKHVGRFVVTPKQISIAEDSVKPSHTLAKLPVDLKPRVWHKLAEFPHHLRRRSRLWRCLDLPSVGLPHAEHRPHRQEGMLFPNMRANCTVCSPSRAALLTGRYPDRVGVPGVIRTKPENSWGYLAPGIPTIGNELKKAGYHTAVIGKWHLGLESPNTPNERGFDLFHGFLGDMMDSYTTHLRQGNNYMRLNAEVIDPQGHATDIFAGWAADYFRERAKERQPFFLYLAYNAPHFPIEPPPTGWRR